MKKYYFALLFITICDCKIKIQINTSNFKNQPTIKHEGSDIKQVTDREIALFNITNDNLKLGVGVQLKHVPEEVFLKDPTPYGEVYKKYNWPDVKRRLIVKNITIVEVIKQDTILQINDQINKSTAIFQYTTDVVVPVRNTVTAIWDKEGLPEDRINYDVNIDFGYGEASLEAVWRDSKTSTFDLHIKKTKSMIDIQPGQTIVSKLVAEQVKLLIEIELEAHLVGNIVAYYAHTFGKFQLWAPTIESTMKAAELSNELTTKLLLEVRYYTNPRLEIKDKETGKEISNL